MRRLALVLLGVLCACPKKPSGGADPEQEERGSPPAVDLPGCPQYGEPQPVGRVPPVLAELSGLAASVRHPGILWAHNDSGNAFQLFALEPEGTVRATFTLTGATPVDMEDIAVGPCAPGDERSCLYLADIGDNHERRAQVSLYRLPEPQALGDATLPVEVLPFRYPDRPRDAEALVLEARSGRLALITKSHRSLGEVFVLEGLGPGRVGQARRLGELRAPGRVDRSTTAADLHPSGERLLLRTYTRVWEVRRPGATNLEALLEGEVVELPGPSQSQSEAITFLPGGRSWLVGSEFAGQHLFQVECR